MNYRTVSLSNDASQKLLSSYLIQNGTTFVRDESNGSGLWCRWMSSARGRSMRSKVERRMQKETGKTLREIRRAKKIKKKLMTDEERLIYNLKRVCV